MCRLLGFQGPASSDLRDALLDAPNALIRQSICEKSAGKPNEDGWGVARWESGGPQLTKKPTAAHTDPDFRKTVSEPWARGFVHIRRSSVGKPAVVNTHPFRIDNDLIFAHNGSVYGFEKVRDQALSMVHPDLRAKIQGETDSECVMMLFATHFLRDNRWDSNDIKAFLRAVCDTVATARRLSESANSGKAPKLNFMLLTKEFLITTRVIHTLGFYEEFKGGTLITSEPMQEGDRWVSLEEDTMLFVSRDGSFDILTL